MRRRPDPELLHIYVRGKIWRLSKAWRAWQAKWQERAAQDHADKPGTGTQGAEGPAASPAVGDALESPAEPARPGRDKHTGYSRNGWKRKYGAREEEGY